jgi:hypothetical protein
VSEFVASNNTYIESIAMETTLAHFIIIIIIIIIIIKQFYVAIDNINFPMSSCKATDILLCCTHIRIF